MLDRLNAKFDGAMSGKSPPSRGRLAGGLGSASEFIDDDGDDDPFELGDISDKTDAEAAVLFGTVVAQLVPKVDSLEKVSASLAIHTAWCNPVGCQPHLANPPFFICLYKDDIYLAP